MDDADRVAAAELRPGAEVARHRTHGVAPGVATGPSVARTAVARLLRLVPLPPGLLSQVVRFAGIGVLSTLAYLLLYTLFREPLGAQGANFTSLLITAVGNTLLNRRYTFGVTGGQRRTRHVAQGLVVFGLALGLTSGSLAVMHAVSATPPRTVELAVLVVANLAATCLRFTLLRQWVFRHRHASGAQLPQEAATS